MLATIPFSGFYNSAHSDAFDREIEQEIEYFYDETGEDLQESICDALWYTVDYSKVHTEYAKEYAESFIEWLSLDGKFESMTSPREYNFSTDRIFVELSRSDIAKMWKGIDKSEFSEKVKERFTSHSGFTSFYSNDWRDWGRLSAWDHNQLGILVEVYAETEQGSEWDMWAELDLMENAFCNGGISEMLHSCDKYTRVSNIVYYLRQRAQRSIRTMTQWHDARRAMMLPFADTPLGSTA